MPPPSGGATPGGPRLSRRRFLAALAVTSAAVAGAATVRPALAHAAPPDPVDDTLRALLAFVAPGDDPYSRQQGAATDRPGGVHDGAVAALRRTLDQAVPVPYVGTDRSDTLPGAAGVTALLGAAAVTLVPSSAVGPLGTPFARLSLDDKARLFDVLDRDRLLFATPAGYAVNAVPALAALVAFSEVTAFDTANRTLTGTPVGWTLTGYAGPSNGWDEFRGYYT